MPRIEDIHRMRVRAMRDAGLPTGPADVNPGPSFRPHCVHCQESLRRRQMMALTMGQNEGVMPGFGRNGRPDRGCGNNLNPANAAPNVEYSQARPERAGPNGQDHRGGNGGYGGYGGERPENPMPVYGGYALHPPQYGGFGQRPTGRVAFIRPGVNSLFGPLGPLGPPQ